MPKYKNERIARLDVPEYKDIFENKGVKFLDIRRTVDFENITNLNIPVKLTHTWTQGDTLYRLSYLYYGVYKYWWTIALLNNKPTDAHYELGDQVLIPNNPENIISFMS